MEAELPCPPSFSFFLPPPLIIATTVLEMEAKIARLIRPLSGYGFPCALLWGGGYSFDMPSMGGGKGFTELEEEELLGADGSGGVGGAKGKSVHL